MQAPVRNEARAEDPEHEPCHEHGLSQGDEPVAIADQVELERSRILKIFSPKNLAKKLAFLTQNKAKF
jgi:hypothetical protein